MLKIMYFLIVVAFLAGGASLWFAPKAQAPVLIAPPIDSGTLCTMDAMQCPDGSYVGRTGSQCEFVCPAVNTTTTTPSTATSAVPYYDEIVIVTPTPHSLIASTTVIKGKARGSWYFEGSFPIQLVDMKGMVLAKVVAKATADWMSTDFVPFSSTLTFANPKHLTAGILRFKNDNPSGLPANDKMIEIPVRFTP